MSQRLYEIFHILIKWFFEGEFLKLDSKMEVHEKNDFAERSKILVGNFSRKSNFVELKVIM